MSLTRADGVVLEGDYITERVPLGRGYVDFYHIPSSLYEVYKQASKEDIIYTPFSMANKKRHWVISLKSN
ncbi:hypothetical protein ABN214_15920 [Proteus terrae]|uniref:hypothetical protein n=1 Tax=Proteus terrae TaxID=1574161 RepID=UPI0032DA7978